MEYLEDILVPIFICVVMPVAIVLINAMSKIAQDKQRTQIIIKAIEADNNIDADKLAESLRTPVKTDRQILNNRLLRGCIFGLVGLVGCIIGIINLCTGNDFNSEQVSLPFYFGGVLIAVGASYLIVYFVTRRQIEQPEK